MVAFSKGRGPKGLIVPGGIPTIDWDDPITDGLLGCYVVTGEGGASKPFIRDLVTENLLTVVGSPVIVPGKTGMQAQDASGAGWTSNVPPSQKVTGAFSVMWSGSILGTGSLTDNPPLFACTYANSYTTPFNAWGITRSSSQTIVFAYWNQGGNVEEIAVSAALTTGGNYCVLGSNYPGAQGYCWINGRLGSYTSTGSSSAISYGTSPQIRVGLNINNTNYSQAGMSIGALWGRQLDKGESARMSANPASFLLYPTSKVLYFLGGKATSPVTVAPPHGSIVLTGATPTVKAGNTVAPAHGSIVLTGQTPSVKAGNTVAPSHGSIVFTGETPSIVRGNTLSPAAGSIVFTGETPSVVRGNTLAPGHGSIVFTGQTPSVTEGNTVAPPHGSIVFTGETPTVSFTNTVSPSAGSIIFTGQTPSVTSGNTVAPPHGSIVFTGETPTVSFTNTVSPTAGSIVFTGQTPSVTTGNTPAPAHGSIVFTGETPSVKYGNTLAPASGSIVFTGETPVVSTGGNTVSPGHGSIVFTGKTPSVLNNVNVNLTGVYATAHAGTLYANAQVAAKALRGYAVLGNGATARAVRGYAVLDNGATARAVRGYAVLDNGATARAVRGYAVMIPPTGLITGVSAAAHVGTLTPYIPVVNVTISGVYATAHAGTLTLRADASPHLTGVISTATIGNLGAAAIKPAISGVYATGETGNLTAAIKPAISGVYATSHIGSVTLRIDSNLYLTGVSSTATVDSLTALIEPAISGVYATSHVGNLNAVASWLTGVYATCETAAIHVSLISSNALVGVSSTGTTGSLLTFQPGPSPIRITGVTATAQAGSLISKVGVLLSGAHATSQIGDLSTVAIQSPMSLTDLAVTTPQPTNEHLIVTLRWSDTDGYSWAGSSQRGMGSTGAYLTSLQWRRLGMSRRGRVFELSWSEPSPTALLGATIMFDDAAT